ncbi:MAG: cytochrome C-binding protein [Bryobacteraceae bacterium]
MKLRMGFLAVGVAACTAWLTAQQPAQVPPALTPLPWAYPLSAPAPPAAPNTDPTLHHVPNSTKGFTMKQIGDGFNPPDWHPEDHPAMPDIVGHGRAPDIRACGFCHLPNGQGRPENSSLAGLPAAYIEQQVTDYRNNLRKSAEPSMGPPANMLKLALVTNEAEVKIAAEYFSKIKYKQWIRVVETKTVPKYRVATGMLIPLENTSEPIGERIIEMPENVEVTEIRDSQSGFVAYVPVGSVKKGEALVTKASAKTIQCAICHGEGLKGLGNVPFLAGRSPSYIVRQMYDIKVGARKGGWSPLMKAVVEKLTPADMVAIAAYTASLKP